MWKSLLSFCFVACSLASLAISEEPKSSAADYIQKWHEEAVRQMIKYKIPASITLAQGLLESGNGNSRLATQANNHFGIKCHSDWKGATMREDDETKNECFRKYNSPEQSFEDHSVFLTKKRYEPLFELKISDYKGWAHGLKKCGYATNPKYPQLLINLIEQYNLTQYDEAGLKHIKNNTEPKKNSENKKPNKSNNKPNPADNRKEITLSNQRNIEVSENNIKFIIAKTGDSPESIAEDLEMATWQIKKYNDLNIGHIEPGERVYIQPKRNKAKTEFHTVKAGDTLWKISQEYGIKLNKLIKLNRTTAETPIQIGAKIKLK